MDEVGNRLTKNPVHRALSRPNLLMGGDRELVLITGVVTVILVFVVLTIYSAALGLAIWIGFIGLLRLAAKADPLMRQVYVRHIFYRSSYRPTTTPWRKY